MDRPEIELLAWKLSRSAFGENRKRFGFLRGVWRRAQEYSSSQPMQLDPATIFMLIQIAIQIWKWAKDNGYLSLPETIPAGGPDFSGISRDSNDAASWKLKAYDGIIHDRGEGDD